MVLQEVVPRLQLTAQAVVSDLKSGVGSATGKLIGSAGADATITVGTGLAFAAGKAISKFGNTTIYSCFWDRKY